MRREMQVGPVLTAVVAGGGGATLLLFSGVFPRTTEVVVWLIGLGICWAATGYCVIRAKEHLNDNWVNRTRAERWFLEWSRRSRDYDEEGKPWLWGYWACVALTMVEFLCGFFWIANRLDP